MSEAGRGAAGMKGGLGAMITAARAIHASGITLNGIDKMARVLAAFERYRETLSTRQHPLTGTPAFVSCIIQGGWRSVIVADRCSLHVTTHLVPGETAGLRLEEVAGILEGLRAEDPDLDYRLLDWKDEPLTLPLPVAGPNRARLDPPEISRDEPIVPALACGPGNIDQAHTYDEWVEAAQLADAARLYAAAAVEFLGTR